MTSNFSCTSATCTWPRLYVSLWRRWLRHRPRLGRLPQRRSPSPRRKSRHTASRAHWRQPDDRLPRPCVRAGRPRSGRPRVGGRGRTSCWAGADAIGPTACAGGTRSASLASWKRRGAAHTSWVVSTTGPKVELANARTSDGTDVSCCRRWPMQGGGSPSPRHCAQTTKAVCRPPWPPARQRRPAQAGPLTPTPPSRRWWQSRRCTFCTPGPEEPIDLIRQRTPAATLERLCGWTAAGAADDRSRSLGRLCPQGRPRRMPPAAPENTSFGTVYSVERERAARSLHLQPFAQRQHGSQGGP